MNDFVAAAATKMNFTSIARRVVVAYLLVSLTIGLVVERFSTRMMTNAV